MVSHFRFLSVILMITKATDDSRLRPLARGAAADWCRHLANSVKHNVVWLILPRYVNA